jgi:hypothetical protein
LADLFCKGRISERELFDRTPIGVDYDALYVCSIITLPEYRRGVYATKLLTEGIARFPHARSHLFAWAWSREGKALARIAKEKGYEFQLRS